MRLDEKNTGAFLPELKGRNVFVLIWTTTPWTLPANLAIAFHPDFQYVAIEQENEVYIIAEGRLGALERKDRPSRKYPLENSREKNLKACTHIILSSRGKSVAVLGDFVSLDEGTGIVHIAPGHGEDDYEIGLKYGLDIYAPVDKGGSFKLPD